MDRIIDLYTIKDLASALHVTRRTIYNHMKNGRLKGRKVGEYWYFTEAEVIDFLNSGTTERKPGPKKRQLP